MSDASKLEALLVPLSEAVKNLLEEVSGRPVDFYLVMFEKGREKVVSATTVPPALLIPRMKAVIEAMEQVSSARMEQAAMPPGAKVH